MMKPIALLVLVCGLCATAHADIWMWVDEFGETHFVSTNRPIYTWLDGGEVTFSDKPEHPNAQRVELAWHSSGNLPDAETAVVSRDRNAIPGETAAEATERRAAEAYYCSQAMDILETYQTAPQLFRTDENGEREYLSVSEAAATLVETQAKVDDLCN